MKKENFSQNMKDRMQQFEDGGLRLLKKGQKGIVHAIFSRFGLVLLLMLSQPLTQRSVWSMYGAGTIFFIKMPPSGDSALSKQSEVCYYVG